MTVEPPRPRRRGATATSAFGVGRRESHDASDFYARFTPPELSTDVRVAYPPKLVDEIVVGDAREVLADERYVLDDSVALMVTSPPYFAGKQYEEALGEGHIPASYTDYLAMLRDVFGLVKRKLEPGGRIAVNVANLGRKPYRSLAADVITILQDDLGLLLRGEIIWQKALGASGNVAWGSFQSARNPVLRDVTERIIVASKGRFDRAIDRSERAARGLPHRASIDADRFMDDTIDLWEVPPESATRVGHPAPFPVDIPRNLIELYTYEDDLVLDPFMGSGSTAVAAVRSRRHFVGIDTDPQYAAAARSRVEAERDVPATPTDGRKAKDVAARLLAECGFRDVRAGAKLAPGVPVDFAADDVAGGTWFFELAGSFTSVRAGLHRTDTVWKAIGRAALVDKPARYVLLTIDRPGRTSAGERALRAAMAKGLVHDALELHHPVTAPRLRAYASGDPAEPAGKPFGD
jgi:site-specific DNA-methyltransferase (adenine-specific)